MTILALLCELIIDCEHKTAPTVENGYPLIRTPDIGIGRLHIEGASRVDEATYEQWTKRAAPREGDLILAREAPVGNIGIIKSGVRPVLGQRTVLIRPKTDILDPGYLNYLLSSPPLRGWMIGVANGATVPHLNMSDIRSMEIPVIPSIDTQRKIASVLTDYDDLIEHNNRRIKLVEEMAQRTYREWFVDFRYPGHQAVPLGDSELGPIPEGWKVSPIGKVTPILGGGTPSKTVPQFWEDGHIVWYTPSDLTAADSLFMSSSKLKITDEGIARSSARLFPTGSVMMTSRATIGVVSITTVPAATNQGFITCPTSQLAGKYHLYFWLKQQKDVIISLASGATFKEINKATFRQIPYLRATSNVEAAFENLIEPFGKQIQVLLRAQQNLKLTRDLLLPRLISGEIDVSEFDIALPEAAV